MKALVLTESELSIRELKSPLKPTTVEGPFTTVKVASAALNHRDQYIREGQYAKIQYPAVLGSDVSGYIMSRDGEVQTRLSVERWERNGKSGFAFAVQRGEELLNVPVQAERFLHAAEFLRHLSLNRLPLRLHHLFFFLFRLAL